MSARESLERQLLLGFVLPILAVVVVAVFSLSAFQAARQSAQTVTHTHEVIHHIQTLQTLEQQVLLTQTAAARAAFNQTWTRVFTLVQDNPPQQRRLQSWRDHLFLTALPRSVTGPLPDNVRLAQLLIATEDALLERRQAQVQQRVTWARWSIVIGLPLSAVLGATLAVLMLRRVRRLTVPLLAATTRVQAGSVSVFR
ncbi:hypothetical protein [Deinococcus ruber]|uniref:Uncharacterized protein n=1 Tax=Deinococcus ruber TaxID=1848197 RepID=A0A918FIB5_9DEIO|nr:hypothetical protein [Deinococcus ruber]GGR39532.1 hypothetical protein GCM10008957_55430 [Deinococcus ruber]